MYFIISINLIAVIITAIFLHKKYAKISKHRIHSIIDGITYGIAANTLSAILITIGIFIFGEYTHETKTLKGKEILIIFSISTILAPYWEELLFRGFLLDKISKYTNFKTAAVFTTLLFPILHIKTPQIFFSLLILSISCLIMRIRHKSVTPCIICHSIFNTSSLSTLI